MIGVSDYARDAWKLRTASTDAAALAELLQRAHGYDVVLRRDGEATRDKSRRLHIELPTLMVGRRRLLLYFAGHGIAEDSVGDIAGYLVPHDGGDHLASLLAMSDVAGALRALACHHLFVGLDCCFAGAFNWAATRDLGRSPVAYKERFELYLASPTWQVLTSAAYDQRAADVLSGRPLGDRDAVPAGEVDANPAVARSPFLAAMIDGLSGRADVSPRRPDGSTGDGIIIATELYLYTRDQIEPTRIRPPARRRRTCGG